MSPPSHLVVVGGGTAAISAARDAVGRGARVTLIHEGLPIGGCCLNVGCVPSKFLIRAAERAHHATHGRFPGVEPRGVSLDTPALMRAQRELVATLRKRNYEDPLPQLEGLRLVRGWGRLRGPRAVKVNGEVVEGDALLLATGSRTHSPALPGLEDVDLLTNENLFGQERLPDSVIVLGGGYIALEAAQFLSRLGSRVTVIQRSTHVLSNQPAEVGESLAGFFRDEGIEVFCGTRIQRVSPEPDGVCVRFEWEGEPREVRAAALFSALGRAGNTERLGVEAVGINTHGNGFIEVNQHYETSAPGVYAAGDVLGGHLLVYTASHEAEQAVSHLFGGPCKFLEPEEVPWVVFTDPQVAGVGMDAGQARERGHRVEEAVLPVNRWPRFSTAMEDRGFLKLYRDADTDVLLGARALCPEAGDLMTELAWIRNKRIPMREVASSLAPYLTLSEGIQKCAARFGG